MTTLPELIKTIDDFFDNKIYKNCYALMHFDTTLNLGINFTPDNWVNSDNTFFTDGTAALANYIKDTNPYKELIQGRDKNELLFQMIKMRDNYVDSNWKSSNLYS